MNYYNEIDPGAAEWLRQLIAHGMIALGIVDETDIRNVDYEQLKQYTQCHFFAGIGGWSYALRLAGWPDNRPVWTGSCPCQPFSVAGKGAVDQDARHLWPAFRAAISICRPAICFGEQVAGADGREWLTRARADLEELGYAVGAADLCAAGVGAPHIRQRLYWMAHTNGTRLEGRQEQSARQECATIERSGPAGGMAILCRDGKSRRIEPSIQPLAHGIPGRMGLLRGYGNAIVPQVAAEFIQASCEAMSL